MSDPDPHPTRRLIAELAPHRVLLACGFACMLVATPLGLVHPWVWMFVVNTCLIEGQIQWLAPALLGMVAAQAVAIAVGAAQDLCFARASESFTRNLRTRIYTKLNRQSPAYFHQQRSGDLQSRVISDVDALQASLIAGFTSLLSELLTFLFVFAFIWSLHWMIGLLTALPLLAVYLVLSRFNATLKTYYSRARELLGQLGSKLADNLGGILVIQAFRRGPDEERQFARAAQRVFDQNWAAARLRAVIFPSVFFLGFLTNVLMLGLGAWLVYRGEFTVGGLVALRGFWWQLNSPIRTLANVNDLLQRALAASARIYAVLDAPESLRDPPQPRPLPRHPFPLTFDRVSFHYTPDRPVLTNLSFTVEPGLRLALAGSSGAGKSTLIALLMRFHDPVSGQIRCATVPLPELALTEWRSHLALVTQETYLFNASIAENVLYGRPDASRGDLEHALRRANAWDFVAALPEGPDTVVGERGIKLSGGQRQRLGIARAFLADPHILLLDEPTSAVEPESEAIIQASIESLMKDRTVVLTSHRPSLLRGADRVLFLHNGRIEEDGTHTALLASGARYAHLYRGWEKSLEAASLLKEAT